MRAHASAHLGRFTPGATRRSGPFAAAATDRIVGTSDWARTAPGAIARLAADTAPVLVEGERGSGKAFVAGLLHECGPRALRPFVLLEASALDESVLAAVLFDGRQASSPAARELRREYAERVRGGTLYVADAGELSRELRARITRAVARPELELENGRGSQARGFRLVFGSSATAVGKGGDHVLRIPALRHRLEDVLPLAEHFAADACRRLGKESRVFSPSVAAALRGRDWPGNVAELKEVVEQTVRRSGPPLLDVAHLPDVAGGREDLDEGINLHEAVQRYERSLLNAALERCGGVQTKAAVLLGLKVSTLNSKLASHCIDARAFKARRLA